MRSVGERLGIRPLNRACLAQYRFSADACSSNETRSSAKELSTSADIGRRASAGGNRCRCILTCAQGAPFNQTKCRHRPLKPQDRIASNGRNFVPLSTPP
jgi:hypothetical protein